MKNKRSLYYLFTLLILVLFGANIVKAVTLTYGDEMSIDVPRGAQANTFNCTKQENSVITLTKKADGSYVLKLSETINVNQGREYVTCTYKDRENKDKEKSYTVDYQMSGSMSITGQQDASRPDANTDIFATFSPIFATATDIVSVDYDSSKLVLDCPTGPRDHCTVAVATAAYNTAFDTGITIKYKKGDNTLTFPITVHVDVWGSVRAYPGADRTCSFGSGWQSHNNGNMNFWYATSDASVTLPTCGAGGNVSSSGIPVYFRGWIDTQTQVTVQAPGKCANTGLGALIPGGTSVNGNERASYQACYEMKPHVRISLGHGTFINQGSWEASSTGEYNIFIKEATSPTDKITLPGKTDIENTFGAGGGQEFKGWIRGSDGHFFSFDNLEVEATGAIYYASYDYVASGDPTSRFVYIGVEDFISKTGRNVTACSSDDTDSLEATTSSDTKDPNGNVACKLMGKKVKDEVIVTVTYDGGTPIEYHVAVVSPGGFTYEFEPEIQVSYVQAQEVYDHTIFSPKRCESGVFDVTTLVDWPLNRIQGSHLNSSVYGARCKGDTGDYTAGLCMDPGIHAPYDDYVLDNSFVNNSGGLIAMVDKIDSSKIQTGGCTTSGCDTNYYRMGVNTAFRIAFAAEGKAQANQTGSSIDFQNAGAQLAAGSIDGALGIIFTQMYGDPPGGRWEAYEVTKDFLQTYIDHKGDAVNAANSKDFEVDKGKPVVTLGDDKNSYTIEYEKVKIKAPSGVELTNKTYSCSNCGGFNFDLVDIKIESQTEIAPDSEGRKTFYLSGKLVVNDIKALKIPQTDAEKQQAGIEIEFSSTGTIDIFVIEPATPPEKQRLLFFARASDKVVLYLDPLDGDVEQKACDKVDALYLSDCETVAGGGSGECNIDVFVEACCGLVNEGTYPALAHNVCSNNCAINTVAEVCEFEPYSDSSRGEKSVKYNLREGVKYKITGDSSQFEEDLSHCVVDINEFTTGNVNAYKHDGAGNLLNVANYEGNHYCQVTCKEDWMITMGTFGSYMGAEAVVAGSYFEINKSDIFMSGQQTCYTTKLNFNTYKNEQVELGKKIAHQYNIYSDASHRLRDMVFTDSQHNGNGFNDKSYANTLVNGDVIQLESMTLCKGWKNVKKYKWHHKTCGTAPHTYDCSYYEDDGSEVKCTTINTKYTGGPSANDYTDNDVTFNFITSLSLPKKYTDGEAGPGMYGRYNENGTSGTPTNTSVTTHTDDVTCTKKVDGSTDAASATAGGGTSYPDEIMCSITTKQGTSKDFADENVKADVSDLENVVNDKIYKVKSRSSSKIQADAASDSVLAKFMIEEDKKYLQNIIWSSGSQLSILQSEMYSNANQWFGCQNFVLKTTEYNGVAVNDNTDRQSVDTNFKALGSEGQVNEIITTFNPTTSYVYDEKIYMNIMSNNSFNDNILIPNNKKNTVVVNSEGKYNGGTHEEIANGLHLKTGDENAIVDISYKDAHFYTGDLTSPDSDAAKKYEPSGGTSTVTAGLSSEKVIICKVGLDLVTTEGETSPYVANTHASDEGWVYQQGNCHLIGLWRYDGIKYIKKSVSNSSFYVNKGEWFSHVDGATAHGGDQPGTPNNLYDAIDKFNLVSGGSYAKSPNSEIRKWSQLGDYNVFPIQMTTARNLYKYTYTFNNIGTFFNKPQTDTYRLARLMGTEESVFRNNTRTCFYEVIETICKCCGDPIEYHTTYTDKIDVNVTKRYVSAHGELANATSDNDKIKNNKSGSMGFYNTVSSLSSLSAINDSGGERELAANWSGKSIFNYNGYNRYITNKGAVAAKAIESVGNEIYDKNHAAEYAYRLTPEAISVIKEDNAKTNYGVNYTNLKAYGNVLMKPKTTSTCSPTPGSTDSNCDWGLFTESSGWSDNDEDNTITNINFAHYGSKFLEITMDPYKKEDNAAEGFKNLNLAGRSNEAQMICEYVEPNASTDYSQKEYGVPSDGNPIQGSINGLMNGNCRWVDYIETNADAVEDFEGTDGQTFRLAFK